MVYPKTQEEFEEYDKWLSQIGEIISAEYKRRNYSPETLRFLRIVKGATLLELRKSCGLPSWTTSKRYYEPWLDARLLMQPEYIIQYYDSRRIDYIKTNKNVTIFTWKRDFLPVFKGFFDSMEPLERKRVDAVAQQIMQLIIRKRIGWNTTLIENVPAIFKERLDAMLAIIEGEIL